MVLNRRLGWLPAVQNNSAELFHVYEESIQAKADLVRTAERYVHVEYFILCWDSTTAPFFEALVEVRARGVKVRVLFDHISTRKVVPDYKGMLAKFDQAGIEWHPMLPIQPLKGEWRRPDLRNHRKIVVVDGRAGFVGSQNMVDSSYHNKKHEAAGRKWRELTTRVEGPVVHSINLVFAALVHRNPGRPPRIPPTRKLPRRCRRHHLPDRAQRSRIPQREQPAPVQHLDLRRAAPAIDHQPLLRPRTIPALRHHHRRPTRRRRRTVRRRRRRPVHGLPRPMLLLPALLDAGVRIYLYPGPFVLHSKHFSVDDHTAVIGSSNMDIRSFNLDFEISMMSTGSSEFVTQMREVEDMYRSLSREMTLDEWKTRPLSKRWVDNVMRLTSAVQ